MTRMNENLTCFNFSDILRFPRKSLYADKEFTISYQRRRQREGKEKEVKGETGCGAVF